MDITIVLIMRLASILSLHPSFKYSPYPAVYRTRHVQIYTYLQRAVHYRLRVGVICMEIIPMYLFRQVACPGPKLHESEDKDVS